MSSGRVGDPGPTSSAALTARMPATWAVNSNRHPSFDIVCVGGGGSGARRGAVVPAEVTRHLACPLRSPPPVISLSIFGMSRLGTSGLQHLEPPAPPVFSISSHRHGQLPAYPSSPPGSPETVLTHSCSLESTVAASCRSSRLTAVRRALTVQLGSSVFHNVYPLLSSVSRSCSPRKPAARISTLPLHPVRMWHHGVSRGGGRLCRS